MNDIEEFSGADGTRGNAAGPVPAKPRGILGWLLAVPKGIFRVARADAALLATHRRFAGAAVIAAVFPALYVAIYLFGVWDPAAQTGNLQVAVVNLDAGFDFQGQHVVVGKELADKLTTRTDFSFHTDLTAEQAERKVKAGELAFALVVPEGFSADALPGETAGGARVKVLFSEGNNYSVSGIARRFASELGDEINRTLNTSRWEAVLKATGDSVGSLASLKDGMRQLIAGADDLENGTRTYADATDTLVDGMRQLDAGLAEIVAKLPAEKELKALRGGADRLTAGQRELSSGLAALRSGAVQLENGLAEMQEKTKSVPFSGGRISESAGQLKAGASKLKSGIGSAQSGNKRLINGSEELGRGVKQLTTGVAALSGAITTMSEKMPGDQALADLQKGGADLLDGIGRLSAGLRTLEAAIPSNAPSLEGTASGLASSVEPDLVVFAPVPNNGSAFAPNMVAVAAWVGVVILANMFAFRTIRADDAHVPRLSRILGKFLVPAVVVAIQAALVVATFPLVLKIPPADPWAFTIATFATAFTFYLCVYALMLMVGDAARLIAVLLLTLQLTAGGGILPAELTDDFYRQIHDWLPFTYSIQAIRASLFGALEANWKEPLWYLGYFAAGAFALAFVAARFKLVSEEDYKPLLEV